MTSVDGLRLWDSPFFFLNVGLAFSHTSEYAHMREIQVISILSVCERENFQV
jgi:hypothetical protein